MTASAALAADHMHKIGRLKHPTIRNAFVHNSNFWNERGHRPFPAGRKSPATNEELWGRAARHSLRLHATATTRHTLAVWVGQSLIINVTRYYTYLSNLQTYAVFSE